MYRLRSLTKYKGFFSSLNNVKEAIKKTPTFANEIKITITYLKECQDSERLLSKFKSCVAYTGAKLQDTNETLSALQKKIEEKKSIYRNKYLRSRYIKRESLKLCKSLQSQSIKHKIFLTNATGLSIINNTSDTVLSETPIPEPPPIPEQTEDVVNHLNALGEPTFQSLGLGGSSPVGLVQYCFEYVHVMLGVEWWVAIVIGTIIIRLCLFPLVIIAQRNAARMNNYLPQMQMLQIKMTEARQSGNQIDAARYSQELMLFMKEKQLNPIKNMIVPLAQMPVFISFFMALRQMSNVPVESLRTGGLWWFQDLTLPDQYFLLPIITSATLYATIELGTDAARLSSQNLQLMKYVLRGLPLVIIPFTINFPGAILCYWVSTNFISLIQVGVLRIPAVRDYFNIEPLRQFNPESLPMQPKGFREGLKDTWTNVKITKELEDRRRLDEIQFQRAGRGPIVKTYKYDPTKQTEPTTSTPMNAKKRD